ncbi:MAG: hypothetical protein JO057_05415 [Chloroflexi bacterium]|nr:hypothetical protein [Chloroflexota bacterium]
MNKFGPTLAAGMLLAAATTGFADFDSIHWERVEAPMETSITGGPWTLEQAGAANGLKSSGYCDANGHQVPNPGNERMQPYYFPFITGSGNQLQGYFDYRPKDIDEAVVAASSRDGGQTWNFQQEVLQLRTTCPTEPNKEPDGDVNGLSGNNADNGDDDGQGHQFVMSIGGHTYLYTLDRAVNHIDSDDLYLHELTPTGTQPLNGAPAMNDGPTDTTSSQSELKNHTTGLLNPDGILGAVPGSSPVKIIYEQKILNGDTTGTTAMPAAQQCNTAWAPYYKSNPFGTSTNDDITHLRLAETTDGITFKDLGILQGLNDPTTVSATGTRWLATAGTILKLGGNRFGLLFSGGGCIDGDSDAFRYIGYAESTDLLNWTVVNGLQNPILIASPYNVTVDASGAYSASGSTVSVPMTPAIGGVTSGFFAGRVYAPSATRSAEDDHASDNALNVFFAGYHTPKPKNGLGDYRTIGRVTLRTNQHIEALSTDERTGPDR